MDAALAEERTERREQMIRKRGKEVYGEQQEGGRGYKHGRKRGTEGREFKMGRNESERGPIANPNTGNAEKQTEIPEFFASL